MIVKTFYVERPLNRLCIALALSNPSKGEDFCMNQLTALSLSIGVLSGVATFFAVGPAAGVFFIWAATIAWAAYYLLAQMTRL